MIPTTPRESRKASNSSPITKIFFGGPSASGNSADSSTGSQNRRSNSPMPVPAPLSVRNRLSSARSMGGLRGVRFLLLIKLDAGPSGRQRAAASAYPRGWDSRRLAPLLLIENTNKFIVSRGSSVAPRRYPLGTTARDRPFRLPTTVAAG